MRKHLFTLFTALLILCGMSCNAQEGFFHDNIVTINDKTYKNDRTSIVYKEANSKTWKILKNTRAYIDDVWTDGQDIYFTHMNDSQKYKIDPNTKKITLAPKANSPLEGLQVTGAKFVLASRGCFHYTTAKRIYAKEGDYLVLKKDSASKDYYGQELKNIPDSISIAEMNQIVDYVSNIINDNAQPFNLTFTAADKKDYKNWLSDDKQQSEMGIYSKKDLAFYLNATDSLDKMSSKRIRQILTGKEMFSYYSTTTDLTELRLELNNGEKLLLINKDYSPKYFLTPWTAYYKNEPFKLKDIELGKKINDITKGHFIKPLYTTKHYAIYKIAQYLYDKKEEEERFEQMRIECERKIATENKKKQKTK